MHAFLVLGLVFSISSQEMGLGKRLRNDLFCVEWDVKPQLSQAVNQSILAWIHICILLVTQSCSPSGFLLTSSFAVK